MFDGRAWKDGGEPGDELWQRLCRPVAWDDDGNEHEHLTELVRAGSISVQHFRFWPGSTVAGWELIN
ncbi:hypothetical protein GCM10029978_044770 [Actinoallomurus acanthiterrae]